MAPQSALLLAGALRDLSRAPPLGWSPDGTLLPKADNLRRPVRQCTFGHKTPNRLDVARLGALYPIRK